MTRLGFVSTMSGVPWGGSEELWSQTALRLAGEGERVAVNVPWWPQTVPQVEAVRQAGCAVTRRDAPPDPALPAKVRRRLRRLLRLPPPTHWLDAVRPGLVVISQGAQGDGLPWMEECGRRGIPYVPVVHCADECYWPDPDTTARLRAGYEDALVVFFVSEGNRQFVRTQLAAPLPDARIVRNPCNVRRDADPPWPPDDGVWRLACVGRLEMRAKGQDLLFEVLRQAKWRERPLRVTLYGSGPSEGDLRRLQTLYGVESIEFGGFMPDVEALWARHHALVLPSRIEGLPLVIVEAMLCGRPCIVTDVAGNAELLGDGVTGFVAAAPRPARLDEALERAWARRDDWRAMGLRAAEEVRRLLPPDPIGLFAAELRRLLPQSHFLNQS